MEWRAPTSPLRPVCCGGWRRTSPPNRWGRGVSALPGLRLLAVLATARAIDVEQHDEHDGQNQSGQNGNGFKHSWSCKYHPTIARGRGRDLLRAEQGNQLLAERWSELFDAGDGRR